MSGGLYRTTQRGTGSATYARRIRVEVDFNTNTVNYYTDKNLYATGTFQWKVIVPTVFLHYAGIPSFLQSNHTFCRG